MTTPPLLSHQVEARDRALKHDGFALFMEQRTMKTRVSYEVIKERSPKRLLIACPEIAIAVWEAHREWGYGLPGTEVRIMTWDSLWSNRRRLKTWCPDFVVADELHYAKNRHSKRSRVIRACGRRAKWRLGLTGTPQETGLEDYWAQMNFVDPELFGEWSFFKERYLIMGGFKGKQIVGYQNEGEFTKLLYTRAFRVELEEIKPHKTDIAPPNIVRFDLEETDSTYRAMEKDFMIALEDRKIKARTISGEFVWTEKRITAPRAITLAMKLHQLSGGFLMDENRRPIWYGYEKLTWTGALLLELGRVPVVIFVRFIPELYRLGQLCRVLGRSVTLVSGKNKFRGFDTDVIVVQIQSGISIDLSRAEEAIFHSWTYSHLTHDQSKSRILSYWGLRARYHYLVANGTVDEDLLKAVMDKVSFAKLILNKYRRKYQ